MDQLSAWSIEGDHQVTGTHAGCAVTVQVEPAADGRWIPTDVRMTSPTGVPAEAVRTLPLRAIEAVVNRELSRFLLTVSRRRPSLKLNIPAGSARKPDSFYRSVANAYTFLAVGNRAPAAALAEINDVPVTTVHRWVKEARARGLLAPGQKGRAS